MSFQIRTLMVKLSPQGDQDCGEDSDFEVTVCCAPCQTSKHDIDEEAFHCGDSEGGNEEEPAGAAPGEGSKGLAMLQQQLQQSLSQAI